MKTPPTIIAVEDERVVAKDLEVTLRRLGLRGLPHGVHRRGRRGAGGVQQAGLGADGCAAARRDGRRGGRRLIHFRHDLPVVDLTAFADEVTLRRSLEFPSARWFGRARETEPYGYLVKPFREKELHATIETALSKSRLERLLRESEGAIAPSVRRFRRRLDRSALAEITTQRGDDVSRCLYPRVVGGS